MTKLFATTFSEPKQVAFIICHKLIYRTTAIKRPEFPKLQCVADGDTLCNLSKYGIAAVWESNDIQWLQAVFGPGSLAGSVQKRTYCLRVLLVLAS